MVLAGVSVDAGKIARSLILMMLIPLPIGLALRAWNHAAAARLAPIVASVASVSMILVVVLTTAAHLPSVVSVIGTFAILGAAIFTALCVAIGWVLGGPAADTRVVLAVGTAQRNAAAAIVVAGQNFTDPKVVVMIIVVMIVAFAMLVPVTRILARRQPPARVDVQATVAH
jgi:BASS family bile acid:Na+ symporter